MFLRNISRFIHMTSSKLAKSSSTKNDLNLIKDTILKQSTKTDENSAFVAYKYFKSLQSYPNPILTNEYKQLPEDSQFIDKHYVDLITYRDKICGVGGKFDDLKDITELFLRLSTHKPQPKNSELIDTVSKFDQFVIDLVQTLKLNGGHLFVLDLLIYNKQVFDHCEKIKHTV